MFQTKPLISLLCVGVLSFSLNGIGRAESAAQKSARRDIAAAYQRLAQALVRKDITTVAAIEAQDYQFFSAAGVNRNREQDLALTRFVFASVKSFPKVESHILSISWRGPDAIVMSQCTAVLMMVKAGKTMRTESVSTARDYWSRGAKGWQIRQSVERLSKTWINGQRVQ